MVFTIRKNATLPILKMKIYRDGRNDFHKLVELLESTAITFSMKDERTGIYKVVNKTGSLYLQEPCDVNGNKEYYIGYQFTNEDTDTSGVYIGQFKLAMLDTTNGVSLYGDLIVPIQEELYIHITDSFIKSENLYLP